MLTHVALSFFLMISSVSLASKFKISALAKGQDVTLTSRFTTVVNHGQKFYIAATDLPQTVSFKQVWKGSKKISPSLELAIYDKNNERVQYVKLKKSIPHLYTLRSTERVLVISKEAKGKKRLSLLKNQFLWVDSNKPLTLAR